MKIALRLSLRAAAGPGYNPPVDSWTLEHIDFRAVRELLAGFAATSLGKAAARAIAPADELAVVAERLEETSEMVEVLREVGLLPFGGITNIGEALDRAVPAHGAGPEDFSAIAATLEAAMNVRSFLAGLDDRLAHMRSAKNRLADFATLIDHIRRIIAADGTIRDDASDHLKTLRRQIAEATAQVHDVIHSYLRNPEVRKLLTGGNVTLHGDRYVLPVRSDHRGRLPGVVHRESNTGGTLFVEPNESVQLNNRLVDLRDHEKQEIERLLSELGVKVTTRRKDIDRAIQTLAHLDLLSARAQYAYQNDHTAPTMTAEGPVELFAARHPLLEARAGHAATAGEPVVPIDIRLGSDFDILVITGSNTGGKTVALKTLALIAAMAQSGMHVPARRGATLPVFADVLLDIGDEQSLEQSLSTFGAHIERLKFILARLARLGPRCLVLLDELGSGTDPDEGGAIGQAILDHLRQVGCLAMVSTHFSVLKAYAMNHDRVDNASVEFDTASLRPTYHLHIGTAGESHALTVAERLGLDVSIVATAREYVGSRTSQFRQAMRRTGQARQQAETARADADAARQQARTQAEQYQDRLDDLAELKRQLQTWLSQLGTLQPGQTIHVPAEGVDGTLVRLELHRQVAVIDLGQVQREIPLVDLMPDLGQQAVRREMTALQRQARDRAAQTEQALADAQAKLAEAQKHEQLHQAKAKQFDTWLNAIACARVGQEVSIARKPGTGTLKALDLKALKAVVEIKGGKTLELSLPELFPQAGPFAPGQSNANRTGRKRRPARQRSSKPAPDQPPPRGPEQGKKAAALRKAVLKTKPGERIYVVPFQTAATLVRFDEDKDQAIVSRGAFEMQVAISDCEPVGYKR